jgi:hypothetical protein
MKPLEKQKLARNYGTDKLKKLERNKRLQTVMIFLSVISLGGSTLFGLGQMFAQGLDSEEKKVLTPCELAMVELPNLQEQEKGYQSVLQKEPENQFALKNLAEIKGQMAQIDEICKQ